MEPQTITLETERLLLKEMTPELYSYIFTHYSDEVIKTCFDFDEKGLAVAKERFTKGMSYYHISFKYFLVKDKENGSTVGTCGFYRWYPEHDRAEIGYILTNESYKGKGLATEAAIRILRYGFEDMHVYRAEAFASPANTPSIKILERLGMKYEGLMRGHYLSRGVYEDSACYAILKDEYESIQQGGAI